MGDQGLLTAVSVGRPRLATYRGRTVSSAIWKQPVAGRVAVQGVNIAGDDQADRTVHGGADKAIYAYAAEDTGWWQLELDRELGPGAFGENLTTRSVDVSAALVGERWAIGSTVLEVAQPRLPCFKLGLRHGLPDLTRRFARALRPGAYLRIVREGEIGAGDRIEIVSRPDHDVTVELAARAVLFEHDRMPHVLEAPALPDAWRA
jgi:MOSC domain-containing protein YiiM